MGIQLDDWKQRLADPPVIFSCVKMKHKGPHTTASQAKADGNEVSQSTTPVAALTQKPRTGAWSRKTWSEEAYLC